MRADRPALLAIFVIAAACGGDAKQNLAPDGPTNAAPARFSRHFTDVTAASGLGGFVHVTGGRGDRWLPETMGAGAAFLDYDGDGAVDVFMVQGGAWPFEEQGAGLPASRLYRGRGDGTFEDVTGAAGAGVVAYGMGVSAADVDGDGDIDLFITCLGPNVYLRNDGGRFTDATQDAGLAGPQIVDRRGRPVPEWSTAAAFFDGDGDGDLDLFVANYVEWSPEKDIFATLDGRAKVFTTPDRYTGTPCRYYENEGAGRFVDRTTEAGLDAHRGKALGVLLEDVNDDGRMDVIVANDTQRNFLFLNRGNGRFAEVGEEWGIAYDENGRARAGMGIDGAWIDGRFAFAIGNFSREPVSFFSLRDDGGFDLRTAEANLHGATLPTLTFGALFRDFDLDGFDDLMLANGHIEPDIHRYQPDEQARQPVQLFCGAVGGRFTEVSTSAGAGLLVPRLGRGLLVADVDGDGDEDVLVTVNGGPPALLRNDVAEGAAAHRSFKLRLKTATANTQAIGARVEVTVGGRTQTRRVRTASSYLAHSSCDLVFGCGDAARAERVRITWPDGTRRELNDVALPASLSIGQGD